MPNTDDERIDEEWSERVRFSEHAGIAFRPGEVVVPDRRFKKAVRVLARRSAQVDKSPLDRERGDFDTVGDQLRFTDIAEELDAIDELRAEGISAFPNHVMFSHCMCCGPHPALFSASPFSANPFSANPFSANPFSANPFSANPFSANPFSANPVTNYDHHPLLPASSARTQAERLAIRATGQRRHSAEPADPPKLPPPPHASGDGPHIVIVDTGLVNPLPVALHNVESRRLTANVRRQQPEDRTGIDDGRLDPAAGHGTFIAGIIEMIAPACALSVRGPVTSYGDIDEADLAKVLFEVADLETKPDLVNLSLGGYAVADMPLLARAVRELQGLPKDDKKKGKPTIVVASAGNDATCRPTYPAALPGVVSVGALGPFGVAPFTNYGPWVRACAPGVDVVSTFFDGVSKSDGDDFTGWACWSGTSFATPAVVGALAMAMQHGLTKKQAVDRLIDDPGLFRIPGLGAVVNQTPWWLQSK